MLSLILIFPIFSLADKGPNKDYSDSHLFPRVNKANPINLQSSLQSIVVLGEAGGIVSGSLHIYDTPLGRKVNTILMEESSKLVELDRELASVTRAIPGAVESELASLQGEATRLRGLIRSEKVNLLVEAGNFPEKGSVASKVRKRIRKARLGRVAQFLLLGLLAYDGYKRGALILDSRDPGFLPGGKRLFYSAKGALIDPLFDNEKSESAQEVSDH